MPSPDVLSGRHLGGWDRDEIRSLLTSRGAAQADLFARARRAREEAYGHRVIVRGLLELTNQCRVNCQFCPMRRDNVRQNSIYTLELEEILAIAAQIKAAGINIVFMQAGETPRTTELAARAIPRIREMFDDDVEILLCLGNKPRSEYERLKALGATSYILKHETSDPTLNEEMRESSFSERLRCLKTLRELGYRIGTGAIIGLPGQTMESLLGDLALGLELGASMFSGSPFIPAPDTPLAGRPSGDLDLTLNFIATSRLINPGWLIPSVSALERREGGGQSRGLWAGANVITINFTPSEQREKYLIYGKDRYVVARDHARQIIEAAGLEMSRSTFVAAH